MVDQPLESSQTTPSPPSELILQPYPSDPQARTIMAGERTIIYFFDDLPTGSKATIYKIDDKGNRTVEAETGSESKYYTWEISTYPHQPWEVKFSFQGEETRIYYAAPEPSCVMLNKNISPKRLTAVQASAVGDLSSPEEGAYTTIKFENHLQVNVKIFWVNSVGERVPHGTIKPGGSSLQSTQVGHAWEVFTEYAALPFAVFHAIPRGGIASIESSHLRGQVAG